MITFFDFLYYSIYKLYSKTSDTSPEFAACCAVSGFQAFNIGSVVMLYGILVEGREIYISKLFGGSSIIILIDLNYIRYIRIDKFSTEVLKAKWEDDLSNYRKKYRLPLIIYMALSILLFFGLIFYFGRKRM